MKLSEPGRLDLGQVGFYLLKVAGIFSNFFFFLFAACAFYLGNRWPWQFGSFAVVFVLGGIPLMLYSRRQIRAFKDIEDEERRPLWGRERSGSEIKEILLSLNKIGLWSVLAGVTTSILIALG